MEDNFDNLLESDEDFEDYYDVGNILNFSITASLNPDMDYNILIL